MRVRRKTALLRSAAIESLTLAVELFNRPVSIARDHGVVIMCAHAFEMLLKAVIYQTRGRLRDPGERDNYGFARCINIAQSDLNAVEADEATVLRALKQDRDAAMHDVVSMSEDLLWLHVRSAVTVFDAIHQRAFNEPLSDVFPSRAIPVSAEPPSDIALVVDREVEQIRSMVARGRRQSAEAEAAMRPLLALDGAVTGRDDPPTDSEVRKGLTALRAGQDWRKVLPGVASLEIGAHHDTAKVALQLTKDPKGVPVRRAKADEEAEALAYREVSPFDRYPIRINDFGSKLGTNSYGGQAIIHALKLREDDDYFYEKKAKAGYVIYSGLSPKALDRAREALASGELTEAGARRDYAEHIASRSKR
jgi:hypothetical protein